MVLHRPTLPTGYGAKARNGTSPHSNIFTASELVFDLVYGPQCKSTQSVEMRKTTGQIRTTTASDTTSGALSRWILTFFSVENLLSTQSP